MAHLTRRAVALEVDVLLLTQRDCAGVVAHRQNLLLGTAVIECKVDVFCYDPSVRLSKFFIERLLAGVNDQRLDHGATFSTQYRCTV